MDLNTPEGAANYYVTPYVFYANEPARKQLNKDFKGQGNTISPMFLMNEYFEYIGAEGPAYLNFLSTIKQEYSVINNVYVKTKDGYVFKNELSNDKKLKEQQQVEYYVKDTQ